LNNQTVFSARKWWVQSVAHTPLAVALAALLFYSRRSLDFSDESLYLYLTSSPTQESTLAGVWNWYLNIFYRMSGDDIVLYRQISVVITFACSYLFSWAYFSNSPNPKNTKIDFRFSLLPIVVTTISIVFFYRNALITPGYNWLALIGILISLAGAVKWLRGEQLLIWPVISAVGLGLATMARPTSGILIFLAMLTYSKIRVDIFRVTSAGKTFFTTGIVYVLFHNFFVISISETIKAWQQTLSTSKFDESHSLHNLSLQAVTELSKFPLDSIITSRGLILLPIFIICTNLLVKKNKVQNKLHAAFALGGLAVFAASLISTESFIASAEAKNKIGLTLATLLLFGFLAVVALRTNLSELESDTNKQVGLEYAENATTLLLAGIISYSFSSNNGLLNQSAGIGILYIALYLKYILGIRQQKLKQNVLIFNMIFLVIVSSQVIYGAWQNPYRSSNLGQNIFPISVGSGSHLLVSKSRAADILKVEALANSIDAKNQNLYLVDLSPFTTFIPYQLEFKSIETPLIISPNYLDGYAHRNKAKLESAWIMTSDSKKSVDPTNLLRVLGKTIEQDYELAYTLDGNFCRNLPCRLTLWKPR
jgi:hypothetical protein